MQQVARVQRALQHRAKVTWCSLQHGSARLMAEGRGTLRHTAFGGKGCCVGSAGGFAQPQDFGCSEFLTACHHQHRLAAFVTGFDDPVVNNHVL